MSKRTFSTVTLEAEHLPETHRTLNNDHTVTEVDLPGMVTVYLVIDGGRLPFTQLRGADVLEAIERADTQRQTQQASETQQQAGTAAPATTQQHAAPAPEATQPPEQPAPETQQQ